MTSWVHALRVPTAQLIAAVAPSAVAVSAVQCADHPADEHCRYRVAWSINPHMSIGSVDFTQAAAEHAALVTALEATGTTVLRLPFVHGAYDSVFTKDPALLLYRRGRNRALLARFHHVERRQERDARAHYYERQGYEIVSDDRCPRWEGGDVVMLPSGQSLCFGHGFRSEYAAAAWLERQAGVSVWPLELCDPHLYHLDTALAILPNGIALVCPTALTPQSLSVLERVPGVRRLIMISRQSAVRFALNLVAVGDTIVLGSHDRHIEALVESLGYRCVVVPLRQFHLAGGSAACLVATVHRDPAE
ncbi:MAG TPA: arginine deiminase-related protein [Kofleriaceae bacterium]